MTSKDNGGESQKAQGTKPANSQTSKRQSARARARATKKNVTIDLEAKDVTAKPETPDTKPAAATAASTDKARPKTTASGAEKPKSTTKATGSTATEKPSKAKAEPEKNKPSNTKVSPPVTKSSAAKGGGFFRTLFSAMIGGAIAIMAFLGLLGLQRAELIPAQLEKFIPAMLLPSEGSDIKSLERRLAIIENLPAPKATAATIDPADIEGLAKRIDSIEAAVEAPITPKDVDIRLSALENRLAQLEASVPTNPKAETTALTEKNLAEKDIAKEKSAQTLPAGVSERLTAIEARLSATSLKPDTARLDALNQQITELDLKIVELSKPATPDETDPLLTQLSTELAALKSEFNILKGSDSAFKEQLAALATKVATTQKTVQQQDGSSSVLRDVAQTVALDNLKQVAQSGAPFNEALRALKKTGFPSQNTALLEPYASKGLPAIGALKSTLNELIGTALARGTTLAQSESTSQSSQAPQSAFDKLLSNARSVIKIRKVGEPTTPAGSALNNMQAAFKAENPDAFTKAMNTLEDAQKELFTDWISDWKALLSLKALHLTHEEEEAKTPPTGSSEPSSADNTAQ